MRFRGAWYGALVRVCYVSIFKMILNFCNVLNGRLGTPITFAVVKNHHGQSRPPIATSKTIHASTL